ncbi:hypothetical protein K469DRAFT_351275 [Zopfia rhizophila CBS 207.26]|uniref:Uncharacterized protein n=1 Tax=Zopfia rhizophila CBS 207.26 TaxID=1314779 RepID=A0A6A6DG64_9PEZI|nr:hypothetical protein K469DRAFT_351275 [Zopfia rhizophila CBS 207.26]
MALEHPGFLSGGINTGKNKYICCGQSRGLDVGLYNAKNLLEGNNWICFGLPASLMQEPDFLTGLYSDIDPAMSKLGAAIKDATNELGCPQLNEINKRQFDKYPGYTKLKNKRMY